MLTQHRVDCTLTEHVAVCLGHGVVQDSHGQLVELYSDLSRVLEQPACPPQLEDALQAFLSHTEVCAIVYDGLRRVTSLSKGRFVAGDIRVPARGYDQYPGRSRQGGRRRRWSRRSCRHL
jgi:hypothetical protein